MNYDLEILMPVCKKYIHRMKDFKEYGLVNVQDNKVLLNLLVSNEKVDEKKLESDWPEGVTAQVINKSNSDYIANLYGFYSDKDPDNINSRWIMRIDDDTCTDIGGLVSNLDKFYDFEEPFYLGDLNESRAALDGSEGEVFGQYRHLLYEYERLAPFLRNEIECGIFSKSALVKILKNERASNLLSFRSNLHGGYGDVMSFIAALAKVYPNQCPFISHRPFVLNFSVIGGRFNHIHPIRKIDQGENFDSCGNFYYNLLVKAIDNKPTSREKFIVGSKYLHENDEFLQLFMFNSNYSVRVKFERDLWGWYEEDGHILLIRDGELMHKLKFKESGDLFDEGYELKRISGPDNKMF